MVSKTRILRGAVRDEVRRTISREAEHRYHNELMDDEERQLLLDRIKRLSKVRRREPTGPGLYIMGPGP